MILDACEFDRIDPSRISDPAALLTSLDHYLQARQRPLVRHGRTLPLWARLQQLATAVEPKMQRAVLRSTAKTVAASDRAAIRAEIERGDLEAAVELVPWDSIGVQVIRDDILVPFGKTLERAGELTFDVLPTLSAEDFSITNHAVATWIQEHGVELVVEMSAQQKAALRAALATSVDDGLAPQAVTDHLLEHVGLHDKWTAAVNKYRSDLIARGDPDALDLADNYAQRLRRARALMIARTEPQYAVQNGRAQAWEQAIDAGVLTIERDQQRWLTAADELANNCPVCGDMNDQTIHLREKFRTGDGRLIKNPPETHPGCRCDVILIRDGMVVQ